ncbi:MAG: MATE family efflux transporter [Marinifilaceae bacterium]
MNTNNIELSSQEKEFATAPIGQLFRKYAVAGAVGLVFVGMQTMIDGAFLGNYVGANALASVNLVMPLYTVITAIAIIIGIGCQTVVSISLGEGERQKASDALKTAFIAMIGIVSILALFIAFFSSSVLSFLGNDPVLHSYAKDYLLSFIPFYPFIAMFFLVDYMMKAFGRPYYAMIVLMITVFMNIILDYLFIGRWGLGTAGAAYATGISFSCGTLSVLHILFKNSSNVTVQKGKFSFALLRNMFYNGSSEGLAELSAGITILLFNNAMIRYVGAEGVAAYTFINYLIYVGIIIFVGVSDGIIPILSFNYGAGNTKRLFAILRYALFINATIGVVLALLSFTCGGVISKLFFATSQEDNVVIQIATIGSKICAFAFLLNGINITFSGFFTSMGDARTSIIISMLRGLIFIIIGIALFPMLFGVEGIWLTIPVAEMLTLCVAIVIYRRCRERILARRSA